MYIEFCFPGIIRYKVFFIQEKLKIESVLYSWAIIAGKHDSHWALKQSVGATAQELVSQYFSFCGLQKCCCDLFIRLNKSFLSVIILELIE